MNDEQLVQLLQDKTPDELSLEQIKLLRRRLAESDALREKLFEQLEMEQYLAEALGRVDVSVDAIVAKTQPPPSSGPHPIVLMLVIVACLGAVGFISWVIVAGLPASPNRNVAAAEDDAAKAEGDNHSQSPQNGAAHSNAASLEDPRNAVPKPPRPVVEKAPDAGEAASNPEIPQDGGQKDKPMPEPAGPWVAGLQAPPQSFDDTWYVDFDTQLRVPSQDELKEWFEPAGQQPHRFYEDKIGPIQYGAIEGVLKLKAPWPADAALRFSTAKPGGYRIHAFSGEQGASFIAHQAPGPTLDQWSAHVTLRAAGQPLPDSFKLAGTDNARGYASEVGNGPTLLLRWQDGYLVLTRGDVEMARAPLPQPPEEIYFEGSAPFRGIRMLRVKDLPATPQQLPIAVEIEKPSELIWASETPEKSHFEKLPDGRVRLTADGPPQLAFAATRLPPGMLQTIEIHLQDISPGAGVYLSNPAVLDAKGQVQRTAGRPPAEVLAFLVNKQDQKLCAQWDRFQPRVRDANFGRIEERVVPRVGEEVWVRFVVGAGFVGCWISPDGENWARLYRPTAEFLGPITHLGIVCNQNVPGSGISVRRIRTRRFPALMKLAGGEKVWKQAVDMTDARDLGDWLTAISGQQPAGVDASRWRCACALKTVSAGCSDRLGQALLGGVVEDPCVTSLPLDQRLAVLDELALLVNPWQNLPSGKPFNLPQHYSAAGRDAATAGQAHPFSRVRRRLMSSPAALRGKYNALDKELIRLELLQLVYAGDWQSVDRFCEQLKFYAGSQGYLNNVAPLAAWANSLASRRLPSRAGEIALLKDEWQHPLVEQYNKEAYNLMAEFHAALDSQSYEDAGRMIANLDPYAVGGLVPAGRDSHLLVAVPTAIRAAMWRNDQLARMVRTEFAPLGRLRVNQAIGAGDEAAVRLATVQFLGTEAAASAHRWLGDRALSGGEFPQAIEHYQRATEQAGVLEKGEIAPRLRLACAMIGQEYGEPPTSPVEFGELRMSPEKFEELVAEMRTANARAGDSLQTALVGQRQQAPPPTGFAVHRRGRLDGDPGEAPNGLHGEVRNRDIPWLARQLGIAIHDGIAYVNNRFHVAAYDLKDGGKRLWQSPPPPDRGRTHEWPLIAMRPVVAGERIYLRQLAKSGPLLVCLDRANGQHVWISRANQGDEIISDPLIAEGKLFALTLHNADRSNDQLHLTSYALDTGEMLDAQQLLEMRPSWQARRVCRTTHLADGLLASLGGFAMNVDIHGNVRWIRKQVVLPPALEPSWIAQRFDRPVLSGDRVFLASPGVRTIECLDVDTGRLHWRKMFPEVDRLVGVAGEHVIVHAGEEFVALKAGTGEVVWRRQMLQPFDAELCGGEHGILLGRRITSPRDVNLFCPELVWLNAADGKIAARAPLPDLSVESPRFGPLLVHNDRLWTFFANAIEEPNRDLIELAPQGQAERAEVFDVPANSDPWLAHTLKAYRDAATKYFPQWSLLASARNDNCGHLAEIHGEKNVLALPTSATSSVVFAREISVPKSGLPKLNLRVGSDPNSKWRLIVRLGEQVLLEEEFDGTSPERFRDYNVHLRPVAGQSGWLIVEGQFLSHGDHARTYWKRLDMTF